MNEIPEPLSRAHDQVRSELQRADLKATTMLSLIGATLACARGTLLHAAQCGPESLLATHDVTQLQVTAEHVAVLGAAAVTKFPRTSGMVAVVCGLVVLALARLLAAIT